MIKWYNVYRRVANMKNLYLFIGNEELIIKNKIDTIITLARPGAFNLTTYDMEVTKVSDVVNDCMTMPFLSERKVIIMRHPNFLGKGEDWQNVLSLLEYIDNVSEFTILIIDASNIDIDDTKEIAIKLRKKAEVSETRVLSDIEMRGWLKRQFGVLSIDIEDSAVELFFEYVGTNLVQAKTEVDKLINYIGDRKLVTIRDVAASVSIEGETNVYSLTKAINEDNKGKVMDIYYSLLKTGNDQIRLLNLIYRFLKDSYITLKLLDKGYNQASIAQILNISPGRAYYIMKDAKSFEAKKLEKDIIEIGNLDYNIKIGKIDKVSGMELFLFGM